MLHPSKSTVLTMSSLLKTAHTVSIRYHVHVQYKPQVHIYLHASHCNFDNPLPITNLPKFPINLALLHHFFSNDTLSAFAGDTLSKSLTVELPPMKFYNHSFDEKLDNDHALAYQLDKVVNATNEDQKILYVYYCQEISQNLRISFFTTLGHLTMANAVGTVCNLLLT